MKFKLITSSGFDEYTKDLLGELLGAFNKGCKICRQNKVKRSQAYLVSHNRD